jgi:hypothetical protein
MHQSANVACRPDGIFIIRFYYIEVIPLGQRIPPGPLGGATNCAKCIEDQKYKPYLHSNQERKFFLSKIKNTIETASERIIVRWKT